MEATVRKYINYLNKMKNVQVKLSNKSGQKIDLSLEPEGAVFELFQNKSIILELTNGKGPIIDIQINEQNGKLYMSIWPENGTYETVV